MLQYYWCWLKFLISCITNKNFIFGGFDRFVTQWRYECSMAPLIYIPVASMTLQNFVKHPWFLRKSDFWFWRPQQLKVLHLFNYIQKSCLNCKNKSRINLHRDLHIKICIESWLECITGSLAPTLGIQLNSRENIYSCLIDR